MEKKVCAASNITNRKTARAKQESIVHVPNYAGAMPVIGNYLIEVRTIGI
jgi:hypothetical protein